MSIRGSTTRCRAGDSCGPRLSLRTGGYKGLKLIIFLVHCQLNFYLAPTITMELRSAYSLKKFYKLLKLAYLSFGFAMLFSPDAHAYVDPSTTAMLTQIIAGIFISLGLALGIFKQKIILFFKSLKVKALHKKNEKGNKKREKAG